MPKGIYTRTSDMKTGKHKPSEATKKKLSKIFRKIAKEKGFGLWMKGKKRSEKTKNKIRITCKKKFKGSGNNSWKGGRYKENGYILIHTPKHPFATKRGYVRRSRLVMEKHLGKYLKPEEVVHHKNGVRDDDRLGNLKLFANQNEHAYYHKKGGERVNDKRRASIESWKEQLKKDDERKKRIKKERREKK